MTLVVDKYKVLYREGAKAQNLYILLDGGEIAPSPDLARSRPWPRP